MKLKWSMRQRKAFTGMLFISPWIVGFLLLVAYPLYRTIYLSFNNVTYGMRTGTVLEWVGLENYKRILFKDIDFVTAAQDFFVTTLLYVPVIIALSIIIAVLLNQKVKGTGFFRLLFFLPIIILSGELIENMSTYGGMSISANQVILDMIFKIIPYENVVVLIASVFDLIVQLLWYSAVPILIFLASLQQIDTDMYEAAAIDGASPWVSFWKITLPSIYPIVGLSVVFIVVFLGNFDANPINDIILESKYDGSRRDGYSSALAILYSIIQVVLIGIIYMILRQRKSKRRD